MARLAVGMVKALAAPGMFGDGALPTMPRIKAHFRALPYREVAAALDTVASCTASVRRSAIGPASGRTPRTR